MRRAGLYATSSASRVLSVLRYLRAPESGLLGQGLRFAIAGGLVALIYAATTTVFAEVAALPFQVALAAGFAAAVLAHFSLQRFFVWVHHDGFTLSLGAQAGRYMLVSGTQYASTAVVTSTLPTALHWRTTWVFLAWTGIVSLVNFVIFGRGVFHATRSSDAEPN